MPVAQNLCSSSVISVVLLFVYSFISLKDLSGILGQNIRFQTVKCLAMSWTSASKYSFKVSFKPSAVVVVVIDLKPKTRNYDAFKIIENLEARYSESTFQQVSSCARCFKLHSLTTFVNRVTLRRALTVQFLTVQNVFGLDFIVFACIFLCKFSLLLLKLRTEKTAPQYFIVQLLQ